MTCPMGVDTRLVDQWRRSQEKNQFERRVQAAVAYVEQRVAALKAVEQVADDEPGERRLRPV